MIRALVASLAFVAAANAAATPVAKVASLAPQMDDSSVKLQLRAMLGRDPTAEEVSAAKANAAGQAQPGWKVEPKAAGNEGWHPEGTQAQGLEIEAQRWKQNKMSGSMSTSFESIPSSQASTPQEKQEKPFTASARVDTAAEAKARDDLTKMLGREPTAEELSAATKNEKGINTPSAKQAAAQELEQAAVAAQVAGKQQAEPVNPQDVLPKQQQESVGGSLAGQDPDLVAHVKSSLTEMLGRPPTEQELLAGVRNEKKDNPLSAKEAKSEELEAAAVKEGASKHSLKAVKGHSSE